MQRVPVRYHGAKIHIKRYAMSEVEQTDEASSFIVESEDVIEIATSEEVNANSDQDSPDSDSKDETVETKEDSATDENTEATQDNESGDNSKEDRKGKKPNGVQKRIDEVVRQREDEKRKSEALESRIKELEAKSEPKTELKEPKEADYDSYDDYLDALDKFDEQSIDKSKDSKSEDKSTGDKASDDKSTDESTLTAAQKTALAITQERVSLAEKPDDFDDVALDPDLPVTGEMLEALAECDDPVKVMYHLGKNKQLASEIAVKTPAQQMRAIAKLDLTVSSKPSKPTKLTSAPDAISPVSGSDSQKKSYSEMSFTEFEAEDRARNAKRKSTW